MELITLTKDDPDFNSYLLGTFSNTHRALPEETFHPQTTRERVTFRVVPVAAVKAPPWWHVYFVSTRPELSGLTLGPAMAAWLNQHERVAEWAMWPSWLALVGIFFLHTAVFLLNDVQDHMRGPDRTNRRRGSQVIQKGWVSAAAMKKWALIHFALAVVFGFPAFFISPLPVAVICTLALLCLGVVAWNRATRWGLSDLSLALLFGPLLTVGLAYASFGQANARDAVIGVAFGALTLWVFQYRQFENLFRSRPEIFHTFLAYLNFDRARAVCVIEGFALLLLQPLAAWVLNVPVVFLLLLPMVSVPLVLSMLKLYRSASPLSSSLVGSDRWALIAHSAFALWWIFVLGAAWV
jgi:1,4-dihydroxy-2-naphthoate octaprenyltransferase